MVGVECLRARERPVISGERRDGCEPPNLFSGLGFSVVVYWCASTGELQEPPIIVEGIDCPAWKSLNGKDGENHAGSDTELETLSSDRKSLNFGFSEQLPSLTIFKNKKNNGCYISITIKGHTRSDLKIVSFTRVSYMFCNILQTWGTIRQLRMLLLRSWRWQTIMDCEMLSSPDNPQFLFTILASMDWSTVSESTFFFFCVFFLCFVFSLGLADRACSSRFLQLERNFLNHLYSGLNCAFTFCITNVFICFYGVMAQVWFLCLMVYQTL